VDFNVVASSRTTRPTLRPVAAGGALATAGTILRSLAHCGQRHRKAARLLSHTIASTMPGASVASAKMRLIHHLSTSSAFAISATAE